MQPQIGLQRARLTVHVRGRKEVYLLGPQPLTVGRSNENDIPLADPRVSRFHVRFEAVDEGFRLVDVGSQNGTLRNGLRVRKAILVPGDVIKVGAATMVFEVDEKEDSTDVAQTVSAAIVPRDGVGSGHPDAHLAVESLERLSSISKALNRAPTDEGLFRLIIDAAVELTGSERGFLIQSRKDGMEFAAARNIENEDLEKPDTSHHVNILRKRLIKVSASSEVSLFS